ncbi:IclR family transcriptional regulator [Pseudonocardia kunmingensis]|uniref:Glycerol operon regulatory protein n=1 Tax=Pseudonocardia kunmingensis TaxID=630975 RepID=A0A543DL49_9PSEU|nr:IclR family transcriptional regulator [Pseudonocardia kunmingensis]TQM10076.1 IclR family transcriptional regulator [Pseudonocardia kunmingensis]
MATAVNESGGEPGERPAEARGALDKALALLTALARPEGPHRLAELATAAQVPKPSAHRMLRTLVDSGFATTTGGSYQVGPHLLGMAAAALASSREGRFARPVLTDLQRRTGHTVHYALRSRDVAVQLDVVEPASGYRLAVRAGDEVPLHCTAVGRAILAGLPDREAATLLGAGPLPARTAHTLTDPGAVRAAVAQVDAHGYVVEDEEYEPDVRSIAAPVVDGTGAVVGAVAVSGLTFVLSRDSADVLGPLVRDAAARLSAALGGGRLRVVGEDG